MWRNHWLGVTVDGGSELTPRIELTATPYSLISASIADDVVSTAKIADGAVTSEKVPTGQLVKSINGLRDDVTIVGEGIVTVEQNDNTVTITAEGGAGEPGLSCWDLNANGTGDSEEDTNSDSNYDALDCQGPEGPQGSQGDPGPQGATGLACWDLNGNGVEDSAEDTNDDGNFDASDCQGAEGPQGPQGPPGSANISGSGSHLIKFAGESENSQTGEDSQCKIKNRISSRNSISVD